MYIYQTRDSAHDIRYARHENMVLHTIPHVHKDFEFVYVHSGSIWAIIDSVQMEARAGDCILILPHQIHCYEAAEETDSIVMNFPGEKVNAFTPMLNNLTAENNVFQPSEVAHILIGEYLLKRYPESVCEQECLLYAICGSFLKSVRLIPKQFPEASPAYHTIHYIAEHFQEDLTLQDIARELGYDYHYLSRTFCQTTGIMFRAFVNRLRVECSRELLLNTDKTIAAIAHECGFQSVRSFNRSFQSTLGVTPQKFRKNRQQLSHHGH